MVDAGSLGDLGVLIADIGPTEVIDEDEEDIGFFGKGGEDGEGGNEEGLKEGGHLEVKKEVRARSVWPRIEASALPAIAGIWRAGMRRKQEGLYRPSKRDSAI